MKDFLDREYLTFDDVLIMPKFSTVESRKDVDLSVNLPGLPYMRLPILSANMDTVTGPEMARAMLGYGADSVLHRFCSIEENVKMFMDSITGGTDNVSYPMVSIGLGKLELERAEALVNAGATTVVIDVAHGASMGVVKQVKALSDIIKNNCAIVVGNFATGKSVKDFWEHTGTIEGIKVGIGPGCFSAGTRVLMSDGSYKDIDKIQIHDRVINKNGKAVEVIGVKFSGYRKVVKYRNNLFHKETYATPDHRHWIGDLETIKNISDCSMKEVLSKPDRYDESKIKWKRIDECEKAVLLMPNKIEFELPETFNIDIEDFAISRRTLEGLTSYNKIGPSYDLGYIFGTFLGDGCATISKTEREVDGKSLRNTSGQITWYFGKDQQDIANKLIKCIEKVFGFEATIKWKANMCLVLNRNNAMARFFLTFGKKQDKALPKEYLCSNKDYLKGLLDGFIDSDGHIEKKNGRTGFTNTSPVLSEQYGTVFYLLNGYFPSITIRNPGPSNLDNYNVENCSKAFVSRSVGNPQFNIVEKYQINRINDFENIRVIVPTYDIQVDCESSSFVANNAIVHNSSCLTREKTGVGVSQLSAVMDIAKIAKICGFSVIADGGMKTPGDIAKALGAGANLVMIGGMLAGTDESPGYLYKELGKVVDKEQALKFGPVYKKYRGSASKESYEVQGKDDNWRTAEGDSFLVPYKGPVKDVLQDIEGGLRSGFSYVGAHNMKEFHEKCEFVKVSSATVRENIAHGRRD